MRAHPLGAAPSQQKHGFKATSKARLKRKVQWEAQGGGLTVQHSVAAKAGQERRNASVWMCQLICVGMCLHAPCSGVGLSFEAWSV